MENINFASVGNQIQFIDTIKYFQQSLFFLEGGLANSLKSSEKTAIYEQSKSYLMKDPKISKKFLRLGKTDQEWVLNYLSTGKGTIPYKLVTDFDSFNISLEKDFLKSIYFIQI